MVLALLVTAALNTALFVVGALLVLVTFKRCLCPCLRSAEERRTRRAAVLVLGDVGRSPRMQYHAWSIAELNSPSVRYEVDLIGYAGEPCIDRVQHHPHIREHRFEPLQKPLAALPFIVWAPLKVAAQVLRLLYLLLVALPTPDVLLVQTPPAIPTLLVAIIASVVTGARLVVDWHNFGCADCLPACLPACLTHARTHAPHAGRPSPPLRVIRRAHRKLRKKSPTAQSIAHARVLPPLQPWR